MARILGEIGTKNRGLMATVTSRLSNAARLRAEAAEGEGLRRLAPLLEQLPDTVTAILRPTLGFLRIDCCIIGPGKVMAVQTLHWTGTVAAGEKGQWTSGRTELGRPDRTVSVFCDRLGFSGRAKGFDLIPVVIGTGGPVHLLVEPQALFVQWEEAAEFLQSSFPHGVFGFSAADLIASLSG